MWTKTEVNKRKSGPLPNVAGRIGATSTMSETRLRFSGRHVSTSVNCVTQFRPATFGSGQLWRLLTSVFVHIGIIHLFVTCGVCGIWTPAEQVFDKGYLSWLLPPVWHRASIAATWYQPEFPPPEHSGAIFGLVGLLITTFWMDNSIPRSARKLSPEALVTLPS